MCAWSSAHGSKAQPWRSISFQHHPHTEPQEQHFPKAGVWPVWCEINLWRLWIRQRNAREAVLMPVVCSFTCIAMLAELLSRWASSIECLFNKPQRKKREVKLEQLLKKSASAFETDSDPATSTATEPLAISCNGKVRNKASVVLCASANTQIVCLHQLWAIEGGFEGLRWT